MQVITLNVYVMCLSICMRACVCVCLCRLSSVCFQVCLCLYVYAISSAREKTGRGGVENDLGADTYETGGLIHKHSSKAPGPGNLRGKLLTSQPWRPHCLLCMRSCDML